MAPGRACEAFYDIEAFRCFGDGPKVKEGSKVMPKTLRFLSSGMMLLLMDT